MSVQKAKVFMRRFAATCCLLSDALMTHVHERKSSAVSVTSEENAPAVRDGKGVVLRSLTAPTIHHPMPAPHR